MTNKRSYFNAKLKLSVKNSNYSMEQIVEILHILEELSDEGLSITQDGGEIIINNIDNLIKYLHSGYLSISGFSVGVDIKNLEDYINKYFKEVHDFNDDIVVYDMCITNSDRSIEFI